MHTTEIITKCLGFVPKTKPEIMENQRCKLTGKSITECYAIQDVAPAALNDFNGIFGGITGYVCREVAAMIQNDWNLGSWMFFANGDNYHMLVDKKQAEKQGRPYWGKLVREIYPDRAGEECVIIFTSDFKKRTWHNSIPGILGDHTPVFVYSTDFGLSKNIYIDWRILIETLELIEEIYSLDISKPVIERSLYETRYIEKYGFEKILNYENRLKKIRQTNEFIFSLLIGQKNES